MDDTEDLEEEIDELQDQLDERASTIDELETERDGLEDDLDDRIEEIDELEDERDELEDDIADLEDERDDLQDEVDALEDERDQLQAEVDDNEDEIDDLEDEIANREAEIDDLDDEIDQLEGDLDEVQTELEELIQDVAEGFKHIYIGGIEQLTTGFDTADEGEAHLETEEFANASRHYAGAYGYIDSAVWTFGHIQDAVGHLERHEAYDIAEEATFFSAHGAEAMQHLSQGAWLLYNGQEEEAEDHFDQAEIQFEEMEQYDIEDPDVFEEAILP